MKAKSPTYSVRKGSLVEEKWLDRDGNWADFKQRRRFCDQDAAEACVQGRFGPEFHGFGLFANS
jgi:hypothetical protein